MLNAMLICAGLMLSSAAPALPDNPQWKVLVLIYTQTDFKFSNDKGEHHLVGTMTEQEKNRAETQARRFFEQDVPELTSGCQRPVVTIRFPARALTRLDDGYWPGPEITRPEVEPSFDSVIVIWKASGMDQVTGKPLNVADAGGLTMPMGTKPTYCAIPDEYISPRDRNVFKHEWGHSILFYFEAAGATAVPAVDNHINDTDIRYVHWPTGTPYILKDETDDNLIPNSIYNNHQGFTHDYYSGQTAAAGKPGIRLGITPEAWASGGPVTKPAPSACLVNPKWIADSTPAPLYRDPVYDGAADPVLVWNPGVRAWWMFYTQRRAKLDLPGVEWCHQTEIGAAQSCDGGMTWTYLGALTLSHPDAGYSFWAPDVVRDDSGRYHLFVSYVPGAADTHRNWGGPRHILHYVSDDLWQWTFVQRVPVNSNFCIDPTVARRPDGSWRMWYKDEGHNSDTLAVESRDLKEWKPVPDPGVSKLYGEGPKVFRFQDSYWLIKDPGKGLDVYRSANLESWTYQGKILDRPGRRNDDAACGQHADVVVCEDRAYIIYFTHPYGQDFPLKNSIMPLAARRSALQAAELEVREGKLVCDRDKAFRIRLENGSQ